MADPREISNAVPLATQVWVDAQLPPVLAQWIQREFGVDAVHIQDIGLHSARDLMIFEAARRSGRAVVVLTKDEDFVKLLGQHGPPPQVVWVRCGNVTNQELRRILQQVWPRTIALIAAREPLVEVRRTQEKIN